MSERTDLWQVLVLAAVLVLVATYVALSQPADHPVDPYNPANAVPYTNKEHTP